MDKEWLIDQYINQKKSINDIAKLTGFSTTTIRYYLKKYGIQTRTISQGMLVKSDIISNSSKKYWSDLNHRLDHSKKMTEIQSHRKQQLSKSAKSNWANNRDSIIAGIKANITDAKKQLISNSVKKWWTDGKKIEQSKKMKSKWKDQNYRIKTLQGLQLITDSNEFKSKVSANSKIMWSKESYKQIQAKSRSQISPSSSLERILINILKDYNIDATSMSLGPWTFDIGFKYNDRNILIECQGEYWHSLKSSKLRDKQKKTYFNKYLSKQYELHYIYEYQFYGINYIRTIIDKILNPQINESINFDFKDIILKITDSKTANNFYNKYHYLSRGRSGLNLGAYIEDIMIACLTYTSITRKESAAKMGLNHTKILELDRFCIHPQYHMKNLPSWLLSRSLHYIPSHIKALISFADPGANHLGTIYKASNWKYDGKTKSTYWYITEDGIRYHKKSVWDQASRLRIPETEYANMHGLIKINGSGLHRFIKTL